MSVMREMNTDLATMSRTHGGVRALIGASAVLFTAVLGAAADPGMPAIAAMLGLSVLAAWNPHTALPLIAMGYLIVNWIALTPAAFSGWTVLAALSLLMMHTSAALCASVPAPAPLPKPLWQLYATRVLMVAAVTVAVWLLSAVALWADFGGGPVPALVGFLVLALVLAAHYRAMTKRQADSLR